jgi:hypothetical protein
LINYLILLKLDILFIKKLILTNETIRIKKSSAMEGRAGAGRREEEDREDSVYVGTQIRKLGF